MAILKVVFSVLLLGLVAGATAASAMEGDALAEHSYGGSSQDWGYDLKVTRDGGFILAGYTKSFGVSGSDVYLARLDATGATVWAEPLGSAANDVGEAVIQTHDGGFLVAGNQNIGSTYTKQGLLIKVSADGTEQWQHTYGGNGEDEFLGLVECADGGYAMAGHTSSIGPGGHAAWLVRVDSLGTMLYQQAVALAGHGFDYLSGLVVSPSGGFVASGYSGNGDLYNPIYHANIVAFDDSGSLLWKQTYDESYRDHAYSIANAPDEGYVLGGQSGGAMTIWRVDRLGNVLWEQRFSGSAAGGLGDAVEATRDGGYLVAGDVQNYDQGGLQLYVGKTDADGNPSWDHLYGGAGSEIARAIVETPAGDYGFVGTTNSIGAGGDDVLLLLVEGPPAVTAVEPPRPAVSLAATLAVKPNPFRPATTVSFTLAGPARTCVSVFDAQGRRVRTLLDETLLEAGPHAVSWDGRDDTGHAVRPGLYLARAVSGTEHASRRLVRIP